MKNRKNIILDAYLEADAEKRLHLFLQCPSLRSEFMAIDLGEKLPASKSMKNLEDVAERSFYSRWRTAVGGCCLKFRG